MYGLPEILLTNYTIDNSSLKLSNYGPDRGKFMKDLLKESGITKLPVSNDTKCVALRVEPNGLFSAESLRTGRSGVFIAKLCFRNFEQKN